MSDVVTDHARSISHSQIQAVYEAIGSHLRLTPTVEVAGADFGLGGVRLTFKLEHLQHAGSFKTRGAFAHLLTRAIPAAGVVAASGGSHGVAVAYAAQALGVRAKIFIPRVASPAKVDRIRASGADLEIVGDRYADALAASDAWQHASGALPIHAFDHVQTLLGQATLALELSRQAPVLDTILVPVGGGGLIAGVSAWYAGRARVVGVEPEDAPTLTWALAAGQPVDAPTGSIAAESLAPRRVGDLVFPIARTHVSHVVLVSDTAIRRAQHALWSQLRVVAEPAGATAFAALLSGGYVPGPTERVGVIVSGGNTADVHLAAVPA